MSKRVSESVNGRDGVSGDGHGFVVELGLDGVAGGVEDEGLLAASVGPEAVELAVEAFEAGEDRREGGEPGWGRLRVES